MPNITHGAHFKSKFFSATCNTKSNATNFFNATCPGGLRPQAPQQTTQKGGLCPFKRTFFGIFESRVLTKVLFFRNRKSLSFVLFFHEKKGQKRTKRGQQVETRTWLRNRILCVIGWNLWVFESYISKGCVVLILALSLLLCFENRFLTKSPYSHCFKMRSFEKVLFFRFSKIQVLRKSPFFRFSKIRVLRKSPFFRFSKIRVLFKSPSFQ